MKPVQQIAVAVVEADDQFLVGVRPDGTALAGFHEFPGGKVEPNETPDNGAVRESLEEAGLAVHVGDSIMVETFEYDHATVELHFFAATPGEWSSGQPLPPPTEPFRWIPRSTLKDCRFPDGNRRLLDKLEQLSDE
jgi:8-oxo-dGTP diphosphatase